MNTGNKNVYGRTIYRGPRGGEYTINPSTGRKVRVFTRATAAPTAPAAPAAPASPNFPGFTKTPYTFDGTRVYKKNSSGRYYAKYGSDTRPTAFYLGFQVKNTRNGTVMSLRDHLKKTTTAPAPTTAAANSPTHPGFMRTPYRRIRDGSVMYKKTSSGRYYVKDPETGMVTISLDYSQVKNTRNGTVMSLRNHLKKTTTTTAPAATGSPAPHHSVAKYMKLASNKYISRYGKLYRRDGGVYHGTVVNVNRAGREAFAKDPKYLYKTVVPYIFAENATSFLPKLKLQNGIFSIQAADHPTLKSKVYFNKKGDLYFVTLNGRKLAVNNPSTWSYLRVSDQKVLRTIKRTIGQSTAAYPRSAIPPNSPAPAAARRSSPNLLSNMMNRIYSGGRGANIDASGYTNAEKNVLARRLSASIDYFKRERNAKKAKAAGSRKVLQNLAGALTDAEKKRLQNNVAAANERVGYFDDAVRAYTRGLRAVKPLTGAVSPRARAMPATPNRSTPAPRNVNTNVIYMPLNRPHLVVKTPGAGTIYLNPNTFTGFMRNASRVNIPEANVRDWLRTARRNFPNEGLFRHPVNRSKNVTARHIRFSRA